MLLSKQNTYAYLIDTFVIFVRVQNSSSVAASEIPSILVPLQFHI